MNPLLLCLVLYGTISDGQYQSDRGNTYGAQNSGGSSASGGDHETGGHGNGGTSMVNENPPRIKLILEEDDRIKLVVKGGGMAQIQKVVLDVSPNYGQKWTVKGCKRGTADIGEGSQREMFIQKGKNITKRWVECGLDGQLRRSMKPGEVQNQLKTLLKDLHISGGDVRGEGWTEEDGGQHVVKEVELKQTGGERWIMEVVTGSKREKPQLGDLYSEAPWVDKEEEEEEDEPIHKVARALATGGRLETGGYSNNGSTNMVTENATRIKLILEDDKRIKLVMEGGGMAQIQEVVLKTFGHDWFVKSCKRGEADIGERSQRGMFTQDSHSGKKRWVACGVDGHLRRSVEPGQVQNQLKTLHISGGEVRGEGWTEEEGGQHVAKEVELKQTGGGRWIMEVATGSKREKKRSDDWDDEDEEEADRGNSWVVEDEHGQWPWEG